MILVFCKKKYGQEGHEQQHNYDNPKATRKTTTTKGKSDRLTPKLTLAHHPLVPFREPQIRKVKENILEYKLKKLKKTCLLTFNDNICQNHQLVLSGVQAFVHFPFSPFLSLAER